MQRNTLPLLGSSPRTRHAKKRAIKLTKSLHWPNPQKQRFKTSTTTTTNNKVCITPTGDSILVYN